MSDQTAGPELDALVAEQVMGWTLGEPEYVMGYLSHGGSMMRLWKGPGIPTAKGILPGQLDWHPSTDIAAAWAVVEKLRGGFLWLDSGNELFRAAFWKGPDNGGQVCECSAETAPLAICLAALKSVSVAGPHQETP